MWKRWDRMVIEGIGSYLDGELAQGVQWLDLDVGAIDYARDGYLSPEHIDRLEEIKAGILAGRVEPSTAAVEPPRWNLMPDTTFEIVFDGQRCTSDVDGQEHLSGEVVRANIRNESSAVVGVDIGMLDDVVAAEAWRTPNADPWAAGLMHPWVPTLSTLTAPGAENAISLRLNPASYVVGCRIGDNILPGPVISARFETTCIGPPVESSDPVDTIRALGAAVNERDAGAVCALFAENGQEWAQELTVEDDDPLFGESVMTEYAESDGVVSWTVVYTNSIGRQDPPSCLRAEVDGGKILWLEPVDCDPE